MRQRDVPVVLQQLLKQFEREITRKVEQTIRQFFSSSMSQSTVVAGNQSDYVSGEVTNVANEPFITTAPSSVLTNEKVLGTDIIMQGSLSSRPTPSIAGRLYYVTDVGNRRLSRDTGSSWQDIIVDWSFVGDKPSWGTPVGLGDSNQEGTANAFARADHVHKRSVEVAKDGTTIGTRRRINFVGANITVTDDPANDEVDVSIAGGGDDTKVAVFVNGTQVGNVGRRLDFRSDGMISFTVTEDSSNDQFDVNASIKTGVITDSHIASNAGIAKSKISTSGTWAKSDLPSTTVFTDQANTWTTGVQQINSTLVIPRKTTPASPVTGEIWIDGALLRYRDNQTTPTTQTVEIQANKGVAGGYPELDSSGLIPASRLGLGTPSATNALLGNRTWGNPIPAVHALSHIRTGSDPIIGELDANARVGVMQSGNLIGTRRRINFIAGSNISLSVQDNPSAERVDVSISATASGGTPGGANGAVQFNNNGAFGGDAANLFWNNTDKRLGIRTSSPEAALDCAGTLQLKRQGTATPSIPFYNSHWLRFQGSWWNGTTAVNKVCDIALMVSLDGDATLRFEMDYTPFLSVKPSFLSISPYPASVLHNFQHSAIAITSSFWDYDRGEARLWSIFLLNEIIDATSSRFKILEGALLSAATTLAEFSNPQNDTETSLLLRRNINGTYSLVRVYVGPPDSGGTGYRVLRVPN